MSNDEINFVFGQLNPVQFPTKNRSITTGNIIDSPEAGYRKYINTIFQPDLFDETTVYRAIILKSETTDQTYYGDLFDRILGRRSSTMIPIFTCMIPEIHGHLPNPLLIDGKTNDDEVLRENIISYYPKFHYPDMDNIGFMNFKEYSPGSIVEVQFTDNNYTAGHVRALVKSNKDMPTPEPLKSALSTWNDTDLPSPYGTNTPAEAAPTQASEETEETQFEDLPEGGLAEVLEGNSEVIEESME